MSADQMPAEIANKKIKQKSKNKSGLLRPNIIYAVIYSVKAL